MFSTRRSGSKEIQVQVDDQGDLARDLCGRVWDVRNDFMGRHQRISHANALSLRVCIAFSLWRPSGSLSPQMEKQSAKHRK